jgi:pimeloyl-ACP methyl ester carboxylesterase
MSPSLDEWYAGGERISLRLPASAASGASNGYSLFCRVEGQGQWVTFLHGFPTCSWDWARISPALRNKYRLLMFDFLGFGDSDKPAGHDYSLIEQADLTEELWRILGVKRTLLVAHDYGDTVALELLSRQADGRLKTAITRGVMMNAGLYIDLQRPVLAQKLLLNPLLGPLLDRLIGEKFFIRQFSSVFSPQFPISAAEAHQYWRAVTRRQGLRIYHKLIHYLRERRMYQQRWETVLENRAIPTRFVWGLDDPVSGVHISDNLRRRIPDADLVELAGVGHYPQLEVPERVVDEIVGFL